MYRQISAENAVVRTRQVRLEYAELRSQVKNDPVALKRLNESERSDIADLQAVRDMLRGNYRPEIQNTACARVLAGAFNYMRAMGGVLIGSLADAVRPAMVHGLSAYIKDGLAPMVRGVRAAGLSKKEAQLAGAISEKILASRMASLAEITDPYAHGSVFERFLGNLTVGFSRMTGLLHCCRKPRRRCATETDAGIAGSLASRANAPRRARWRGEWLLAAGERRSLSSRSPRRHS